ncbi:hypothetical protein GCM10022239_03440 [Leifsonia bigeumensis]|uniref:Scaffolding protein n=1 Tax=Leifsonella bigeumensis TaxID=433643 RepID=A0ABP7F2H5_9MICO
MSITTNTLAERGPDGLAIIGRTRHALMGIRYENGEGGDAAAQAAAAVAAKAAADAAAAADAKPPWGDDPTKFDPDKAWKLIQNLRTDAEERQTKTDAAIAAAATKAAEDAQKATLAQFAKLLGGEGEPETDPEKLRQALAERDTKLTEATTTAETAQTAVKTAERALQVALHAPGLGASATLLLANEKFKTSIESVEPTDEAAIKAAITKAVQDTPTLKATPRRSGSGEHQGATVQSLEAQLKTAEEKKDVSETIRLKRAIASARAAQG